MSTGPIGLTGDGLMVFGQRGQVAREIARAAPDAVFLGRGQADLSDPAACAAAIRDQRPRAVINAAAWTAVDLAETQEAAAQVVNADAPGAMARACTDLGIPLVQISTDYVFDGQGARAFAPDDPTGPLNAYGRTKLAGEQAVAAAGGVHVILRTSWVFSAHGTNFVKTMRRLGAERPSLRVVADQTGGPTPAAGIAAACLATVRALQSHPALSGTYHYAGTPACSWADFARAIMQESGLDCVIEPVSTAEYPTPARRPANSRLDCTGLSALGLQAPDWRVALRDIVRELEQTA